MNENSSAATAMTQKRLFSTVALENLSMLYYRKNVRELSSLMFLIKASEFSLCDNVKNKVQNHQIIYNIITSFYFE